MYHTHDRQVKLIYVIHNTKILLGKSKIRIKFNIVVDKCNYMQKMQFAIFSLMYLFPLMHILLMYPKFAIYFYRVARKYLNAGPFPPQKG